MKRQFMAGLVFMMTAFSVIVTASPAQASSSFDSLIRTTDKLDFYNVDTEQQVDVSLNWYSEVLASLETRCVAYAQFCSEYDAFQNLQDGYWMVLDTADDTGDPEATYQIRIVWTENQDDVNCEWLGGAGWAYYRCSSPNYGKFHVLNYVGSQAGLSQFEASSGLGSWGEMRNRTSFYLYDSLTNMGLGHGLEDANQRLFLSTFPANYPVGYEGVEIPSTYTPPVPTYVAMGDSFSSGEGNPPFESDTNVDGVNECHRSTESYPRLLQNDLSLNLGPTAFVACSGATINDVLGISESDDPSGKWNESAQTSVLSEDTEVVTITIGGNDIQFKEFATVCVLTNCGSTSGVYQESWDIMTNSSRSDYLPNKLEAAYDAIAEGLMAANTTAKVYVIGYPKVVTHDSWVSTTSSDPWNCLYMTEISSSGAEVIVEKLNEVIRDAVEDFDDPRFVYVDPLATASPFIGNELCRSDSYFYGASSAGIFGGNDAYVFHPNVDGQNAYRQLLVDAMS